MKHPYKKHGLTKAQWELLRNVAAGKSCHVVPWYSPRTSLFIKGLVSTAEDEYWIIATPKGRELLAAIEKEQASG